MTIWFRFGSDGPWQCIYSPTTGHTYSNPKDWLGNAEAMMRGDRDVLWRKNEDQARRLIWC